MTTTQKRGALALGIGVAATAAIYGLFVRRWHSTWGATDYEVDMSLPGDDIVSSPNMNTTRAITIDASAEDIWPWLVQMGKGRGGLYSYDLLDVAFGYLDKPSADEILPDFQTLHRGDVIPMGCDESTDDDFFVHDVLPNHALVIGANDPAYRNRVSWTIMLLPVGTARTRLIMRVRANIDLDAKGVILYGLLDPAAFIMLRKQMLNLKRLAESTRRHRETSSRA